MHKLTEQQAVDQVVQTIEWAHPGTAPFVLVLGAGFSHGLVPTAKEVVNESLPLWLHCRRTGSDFEAAKATLPAEKAAIAKEFWREMATQMGSGPSMLALDPNTGLPTDHAEAYKAAFDQGSIAALGEPALAREFQRALMQLGRPRLNAAHFLLASILGVQPGRDRQSSLFQTRAAFSRLILTTNFDPFLQIALQAVNRLYFMSDTPQLGLSDEIQEDETDAVHLVYVHGSIHRRSQAASDQEIQELKRKNASVLAPILKRQGVIVLGYSGWDDAIVDALDACDKFDHRLYWCGLEPDPMLKGAFGPRVAKILEKPTTFYVQTSGAGPFMCELCGHLVKRLPRLLDDPIGQLRELLDRIDLKELEEPPVPTASADGNLAKITDNAAPGPPFAEAKKSVLERLRLAEAAFRGETRETAGEELSPGASPCPAPRAAEPARPAIGRAEESKAKARQLLTSARLAARLSNNEQSLMLVDEALALPALEVGDRAELLAFRGVLNYTALDQEKALEDWTAVVELPGAPVEQVAQALYNRGVTWWEKGDTDKALADYTRLVDQLPGSPVEQVAKALFNRGGTWRKKGDTDKALADYTRLIEQLPGAPAEHMARALANRGWILYQRGDFPGFLSDTQAALAKLPTNDVIAVNLGLALLACGRDADALAAYQRAGTEHPSAIQGHGLADIVEAQKTWLSKERAEPVVQLLESLTKTSGAP